jgi:hypothetical protein
LTESLLFDWRRAQLELPQHGAIGADAIRTAYWRLVRRAHPSNGGSATDFEQMRKAKRELLIEAGLRIPPPRKK